jgi:hypothetical protein
VTNLSELLPSGGGAKEFDAVASGTLPNGQTVILKSDGKVAAVAVSSQAIGSLVGWGGSNQSYYQDSVYDPDEGKVIINYMDNNNSSYGECIVGDVNPSNNSITFGTGIVYNTTYTIAHTVGYDTVNKKAVVFFQDVNQSSYGKARVGTVSGTSISFSGSISTYNQGSTEETKVAFSPTLGSFLVVFKDNQNSAQPGGVVGTVSGNNISFGSETTLDNKNISYPAVIWDSTYNKYLFVYRNNSQTNTRYQYVSVSGTTVTAGTPNLITLNGSTSVQGMFNSLAYDSVNQKILYATINPQNNDYGSAFVATSDGSTLTFGTENFFAGTNTCYQLDISWDSSAEKMVISYVGASQYGYVVAGSVAGTTLTFGSPETFLSATTSYVSNCFDSVNQRVVTVYQDQPGGYVGEAVVFQPESSNVSDFIGITSEAIANGATGKVNPQGGVATTTEPSAGAVGTAVNMAAGASSDAKAAYDSGSNQVVFGFQSTSTGYAVAKVGAINSSNNSVSFGSLGIAQIASSSYNSIAYDASADKIVQISTDPTNGNYYGVAFVGTVSGTSITFLSGVTYRQTQIGAQDISYDSTSQKVVICWTRSNYGESAVGTISNGAITFGSMTEWQQISGAISYVNTTYDSNADRTVVTYQRSGTGLACVVGQVSGTSITWGSRVDPIGAIGVVMSEGGTTCFDSQNNKVIIPYKDNATTYGTVVVCTVSGSSLSGGTPVAFTDVEINGGSLQSTFDSTLNKVIITYYNQSGSATDYYLRIVTGTVSGTSITFDTPFVVTSNAVNGASIAIAYDSNANRTLVSYNDNTAGAGFGQVYITAGTANPLTIDATYYVQGNGNITRTATGNTEIGKAISTTQLLLNGAS